MELPPAVIVHGLDDARLVLGARRTVALLSAPSAGVYAGVGWWRAMVDRACLEAEMRVPDVLDCGCACGRALEALRGGQLLLVLRAPAALWEDVADRAHRLGGTVLFEAPPALDLASPGAARRLAAYLDAP